MERFVFQSRWGLYGASNDEPDDTNQLSESPRHVAELSSFFKVVLAHCFFFFFLQYPVQINPNVSRERVTKNSLLM